MRNASYDIIIIGAGPAGATLARLLGRDRSVLLLDGRTMGPHGFTREKCCGGLLAPDAVRRLKGMGLVLPDFVRETEQPLAVRAVDLHSGHARRCLRRYVNLDRAAFEKWLLSLLPEGVEFKDASRCADIRKKGDLWAVETATKSGAPGTVYFGKILAGAEGAASLTRRRLHPARAGRALYLAVQDVFARFGGREANRNEYAAFFHPLFTDFYGWVIPKKNKTLLGAAFPAGIRGAHAVARRMDALRQGLGSVGYAFDGEIRREARLLARPVPGDIFLGKEGAFCIGEAAGWVSPSSGEGFSYAFASARALAGAVLTGKGEEKILAAYRRATLPLAANIFWKNMKSRVIYTPPLRRLVMRSGVLADR